MRSTHRSRIALVALFALCAMSCGSQTGTSRVSDASAVGTPASATNSVVSSPSGCAVSTGFGSAPVPSAYPLRTDAPESDAPIDLAGKRPTFTSTQAAVDDVVHRLNFADIKLARVAGPPSSDAFGPWLYVLATVPADTGAALVLPQWETLTIMGAAAELAATGKDLGDAIEGFVLNLQTPDCQIVSATSTRIGPRASGQVFAATGDAADTEFATGVLAKYGVTPVKVETLRGVSQILSVTASVPDAAAMQGNLTAMFAALRSDPPRFESLYLRLQTTAGEDLAVFGNSPRLASGLVWFQPGLDDVLGITHG